MNKPDRPSLSAAVARLVNKGRIEVTVDDIMPSLPEYSRARLAKALLGAKTRGYIRTVRLGGIGNRFQLGAPTLYGPVDERQPPKPPGGSPVSSVWDMGDRAREAG